MTIQTLRNLERGNDHDLCRLSDVNVNPNAIAWAYKVTIYNAIGNSIKSDLNAAREAGLNDILVGERGWAYDKDEVREAKTNLEILSQLNLVVAIPSLQESASLIQ